MDTKRDALIGYTGFVGGTLLRGREFAGSYNSKNIGEIAGKSFETIYCAGAPAAKWIANREPESDKANIDTLLSAIRGASARRVVLLSTVDVYKRPIGVDERTEPETDGLHAYGLNRLYLERELAKSFETTVLRLPGLFGEGLRKNAIFDLLNNNAIEKIDSRGTFQFYDMRNLAKDIEKALALKISLLNVSTVPVSMGEIANRCFGLEFKNELAQPAALYDFRSIHAGKWGGTDGYLYSKDAVLEGLSAFVASQRSGAR